MDKNIFAEFPEVCKPNMWTIVVDTHFQEGWLAENFLCNRYPIKSARWQQSLFSDRSAATKRDYAEWHFLARNLRKDFPCVREIRLYRPEETVVFNLFVQLPSYRNFSW